MGDAEFTEYVTARASWLRKVAYLLCGDWHRADDLVQTGVTKLYTNWHRANKAWNLDGYVRKTLVNTFLAEQRSSWQRLVDLRGTDDDPATPELDREAVLDLRGALAALPPRQRAAVVLRYYCDLPVDEVARTLGCSLGTVKSQTARGLQTLRRLLESQPITATPES
ncbi:SigE family RNA polymerase sigma factor [Saccharomonospora sp. NPDC046836]|uniref:SigE family RNA polymerase sigma factor n=1 Tax=Saccharomonospora sp. NPDC046836 TaxID=3156921 RepID=UPI0033D71696